MIINLTNVVQLAVFFFFQNPGQRHTMQWTTCSAMNSVHKVMIAHCSRLEKFIVCVCTCVIQNTFSYFSAFLQMFVSRWFLMVQYGPFSWLPMYARTTKWANIYIYCCW